MERREEKEKRGGLVMKAGSLQEESYSIPTCSVWMEG